MKKCMFAVILFMSGNIFAQSGWFFQNPFYSDKTFRNVQFLNSDTGYISGGGGVFLRSVDKGNNWTMIQSNLRKEISCQHFLNSNTGYCVSYRKLYRTINGAEYWELIPTTFTEEVIEVQFISDQTGYISSSFGKVYKTTNGGVHWFSKNINTIFSIRCLQFLNADTGYCTAFNLIYKTTNGGDNWSEQNSNTNNEIISVSFTNADTGYACGENDMILKTYNGGLNWIVFKFNTIRYNSIKFVNSKTGYVGGITYHGFGPPQYYVFKTTDAGNNWNAFLPVTNDSINSIFALNDSDVVAAGRSGAIYKTINGNELKPVSFVTRSTINTLFFTSPNTGFAAGERTYNVFGNDPRSTILKTTNAGTNWSVNLLDENIALKKIVFTNETTGYISGTKDSVNSSILKTTDSGTNWEVHDLPGVILKDLTFMDENTGFACGHLVDSGGTILKTTNAGVTWITTNVFNNFYQVSAIQFIDNEIVFATGNNGDIFEYFLKSTDTGDTWNVDYHWNLWGCNLIYFLNRDTGFLASAPGFAYKTTNSGETWSSYHFKDFRDLSAIKFVNASTGYIAAGRGMMAVTTNGGTSWNYQNTDVLNYFKSIFFTSQQSGYAAGESGVIIKTNTGGVIGIENINNENFTRGYKLYQNYPNPFNPITIIKYILPVSGFISLKVFDILGKELLTLVNEKQIQGEHSIKFNGSDLNSGVYFYRLVTDNYSETKKLVLIK